MSKHSGLPVAVIYIRLLVPLTVQNLLNEFLGQSEGVLRDAATVGGGSSVSSRLPSSASAPSLSPVACLGEVVKIAQNTTQYYNQCICIGYNIVYGVHDYI